MVKNCLMPNFAFQIYEQAFNFLSNCAKNLRQQACAAGDYSVFRFLFEQLVPCLCAADAVVTAEPVLLEPAHGVFRCRTEFSVDGKHHAD